MIQYTVQGIAELLSQVFILVNKYRDGIKTRGDKIGMDLCIIKPLNDVRQKFSADHYAYW